MLANRTLLQVPVLKDDAPRIIASTLEQSHVEADEVCVLKTMYTSYELFMLEVEG